MSDNGQLGEKFTVLPELKPRVLSQLLDDAAANFPERIALDFFSREWTYAQLADEVEHAAAGLAKLGLAKGDRFALCLPNTTYYVILYFAVLRLGGIVVNLNPLYSCDELEHLLHDSGAHMVAVPDVKSISDKVIEIGQKCGVAHVVLCPLADAMPPLTGLGYRLTQIGKRSRPRDHALFIGWRELMAQGTEYARADLDPDDIAVLQYTGGTTGVPKGAMLTHANLAANARQMLIHAEGGREGVQERTTAVLPMFHVFALTTVLNYSIDIAGEIVLLPRFEMKRFIASVKRKPPTQFFGVPTLYIALNSLPLGELPDFTEVRAFVSGGAPLPLEVRQAFERRTKTRVVEGYGLTEASPIITCNPLLHGEIKDNSCGPPFPGTVIEIRDHEHPEKLMPQGERGEVCARGPQVMKGYWKRPDATEKTFYDGALLTGDIGYLDEDGYLFLVDRIKDLILCSGYNVYPRNIEDAAYEFPAVHEAIAIGVPDRYRGEAPWLFVAPKAGMTIDVEELQAFLAKRLNKIEEPDRIEVRDHLPKTQVGKLSKKDLIAQEHDLIREGAK
ncbi:AMP-binding protein [Altererythrobacter salegens]|uniref:AMP-binding protein n=1 Tax=Croceibacterium salegens TaxID=1737568 RepID=A0A6I4SRM4_9SPHN|nr:long-chain fatty acid--CoA ligase [Croceibacterium salegens]MXO58455.1 AMP-binding protein [Croceibacterium salegens]